MTRGGRRRSALEAVVGRRPALEAVRSGAARRLLVAEGARDTQGMRELREAADDAGIALEMVPRSRLDALGVGNHQGVAALMRPRPGGDLDERSMAEFPFDADAVVVVLDGVADPQNLGAASRAAEAGGAAMLVTRRHRAAPSSASAVRASAGALLHLPVARVANITRAVERLKDRGFHVVGLDQAATADIHDGPPPPRPVALVIGSEGAGMSRLRSADAHQRMTRRHTRRAFAMSRTLGDRRGSNSSAHAIRGVPVRFGPL